LAFALVFLVAAQFKPAKYYKVGGKNILSDQVITADFNNDGVLDLAVADALSNKVSILLGNPDGTFGSPIIFQAGYPVSIASGDMNGDGNQDLIVAEYGGTGTGDIGIFLGDGTGHFKLFGAYQAGIEPISLTVADFNGDGNLDVAVANHGNDNSGESMMVFFGNGKGALGHPTSYPFKVKDPGGPQSVAAGDLAGNGRADLALGVSTVSKSNPSFVATFLNDGTGKFKLSGKYFAGGGEPVDIAIADLNNDGKPDIAVANSNQALGVLLNKGGGKFGETAVYAACKNCGGPDALGVGDFNEDGVLDIAVVGYLSNGIYYGKGNGKFGPETPLSEVKPGVWVASGVFGQGGAPDLAFSIGDNQVGVVLNAK
jgi:hypothetical protein